MSSSSETASSCERRSWPVTASRRFGRQRVGLDRARVALVVELDRRRAGRRAGRGRGRRGRRRRCRGTRPGGCRTRRRRRSRRARRAAARTLAAGAQAPARLRPRGELLAALARRPRRRRGGGPRSRSARPPRRSAPIRVAPSGAPRRARRRPRGRKATTVMLSRPPARLASSIRARTADCIEVARASSRAICSSPSIVVSPSEQSRKTSPAWAGTVCRSTSTSGSGPSARVMIERCGWSSAWASVSWPLRRSSSTSEWSRVRRSSLPSRRR